MYPAQQNATDQTANFFWIIVMIFGGILLAWWLARQWIVVPIFWLRVHEIDLLRGLVEMWSAFAAMLHLHMPSSLYNIDQLRHMMLTVDPKTVSFKEFAEVNAYMGHWVRWPVAMILLALAGFLFFRHAGRRFRQVYNMQSLKKLENENWPQITPVLSLDLVNKELDTGPWAMAQMPLDYCKQHQLIFPKVINGRPVWGLKRGPAQRLFALQLGPLWQGIHVLPIHIKALIVIFVARAERKRDIANQLLAQIARSAISGKLDFTGVEENLRKLQHSKLIKWLEKRHAYVYTVMATMLEIARTDGVLATAEFLWLKPVDRRLWYTLNSIGRQTAVVEVSGIFGHWLAEKKLERFVKTPMVKEAVNALERSVEDILRVEEGERWHSSAA